MCASGPGIQLPVTGIDDHDEEDLTLCRRAGRQRRFAPFAAGLDLVHFRRRRVQLPRGNAAAGRLYARDDRGCARVACQKANPS
jgi:hypothetical protein